MFYDHASLVYKGEPFMSPRNFIECVTSLANSKDISFDISDTDLEKKLKSTPSLGRTKMLFSDLGDAGLISFTEYLFLLSLLSRPENGLHIAFKMFDKDGNEELDIHEFIMVTSLHAARRVKSISSLYDDSITKSTILRHLFGKNGRGKLKFKNFRQFVSNIQNEVLFVEFNQYTLGRSKISPSDLARSLVRYSELDKSAAKRAIERINQRRNTYFSSDPNEPTIDFESYKTFFKFIFLVDDFESALSMFMMANKSVSKEEFQRAVKAVLGKSLNPLIVDTIYAMFDYNGDGCLNIKDFSSLLKSRLSRGSDSMNSKLQFNYWPRYIARLLRFRAEYQGELLGWKYKLDRASQHAMPTRKIPDEMHREHKPLPVWNFSEQPPWDAANRLSEFPFPDVFWCVRHPDGFKTAQVLKPYSGERQNIFKGDRVKVLVSKDKGKIGIIHSIIKMRDLCIVENLNTKVERREIGGIKRYLKIERPLKVATEVALMDPEENQPCEVMWRYNEKGVRVRVSCSTGRIIPLPAAAREMDDGTDPVTMEQGEKDMIEDDLKKVTYSLDDIDQAPKLMTFEEEISHHYKLPIENRKRAVTYWY
ncbi:39S ribosomal protein L24, mitochondrial [Cichlidogyrus casuarinus]|uniref:39S ribosomal protein L24, mitochondrial n=1 Tax=Cichlidogyrus casuarinus TaxID=1844966 RepID=A0ABD2PZ39_9PLAT